MTAILAFDTSADACSVAVCRDGAILAERSRDMTRGHAEALVPMVRAATDAAGVALSEIDVIGVTRGPGSFTGVRTGIAAARGFALGAGARVVGVSSLEAVALSAFADAGGAAAVVCILETRRRDYFVQEFGPGPRASGDPAVQTADDLVAMLSGRDVTLAGNAVGRLRSERPELAGLPVAAGGGPAAAAVAEIAARVAAADAAGSKGLESDLSPLYLRAPEAKLPPRGGRLRK